MDNSFPFHIFRKYDIRGRFGTDISRQVAARIGYAFTVLCRERTGSGSPLISVGMDARVHSPAVREAFAAGVGQAGGRWVDLGLCPTPLVYYSAFTLDTDGFAMVTASHNPPPDNGFKLGIGKNTIHSGDIKQLGQEASGSPDLPDTSTFEPVDHVDIISLYQRDMVDRFSGLGEKVKKLDRAVRVVVDSGNGTAGVVVPRILRQLSFDVVELYSEPDGTFPNHHPDPTLPEALQDLTDEVVRGGADVGIAFDGDADRIGVLDEKGRIIWGDMLLLILGLRIIDEWRGGGERGDPPLVISEVKASRLLYDGIEAAGGRSLMWKTGHSLIKAKMKETMAQAAGEMSGHLFFADRYFGYDDAPYAALRLLETYVEALSTGRCRHFSDLLRGLPGLYSTPEIRVSCEESGKFDTVARFAGLLADHRGSGKEPLIEDIVDIDGVRVLFTDGWGLLRASNTGPVLVMRFEGTDEKTVRRYRGLFDRLLGEAKGTV
ncbi:MAG: phosphomannomutase/phosphoglucomutase [bacterium]|nr:phosphomannomutase/phosphoglucomutase [bacterium]